MTEPRPKYASSVVRLHWLSAALILFLLSIGVWMVGLPLSSEMRRQATQAHIGAGFLCLVLTALRFLALRKNVPPPPLVMSSRHRLGIQAVHALQYVTLVGLLLSGIALAFLGEFIRAFAEASPLPDTTGLAPRPVHRLLAWLFAGLLGAHVGGALLNQLQGSGTFQRMGLPGKEPGERSSDD